MWADPPFRRCPGDRGPATENAGAFRRRPGSCRSGDGIARPFPVRSVNEEVTPMGASYHYGRNGRLNVRWTGWRDDQPERYPLEVVVTGRRQPVAERPSLSRWSDKPRRVIPAPDEPANPRALVLTWFDAEGKPTGSTKGDGEQL
jgi:hypothetical protein